MSLRIHILVGGALLALFAIIWWAAPRFGREPCSRALQCQTPECSLRCKGLLEVDCYGPPHHEPAGGRRSASSTLSSVERSA